ncbi:MAG: hypothetical protein JXB00_16765 [Bacteroidales bacterium]|nr:hypothetical protein [Bacteroidales bacterium]
MTSLTSEQLTIFISIIGVLIAALALIATFVSIRYQLIGLILNQLAQKANECNSNLNDENQVPEEADKASGIVTSIIKAEDIIKLHKQKRPLLLAFLRKKYLADQFYLQLHTSIIELIFTIGRFVNIKTKPSPDESVNEQIKIDIQCQLKTAKEFLETSHKRYLKK